jgi:hypothetical protein
MQDRALALMGKKLTAAQALEGKFSSDGLASLAGEDANVEIALARSLVERLDEGDARRLWSRASCPGERDDVQSVATSIDTDQRGSRLVKQATLFDHLEMTL